MLSWLKDVQLSSVLQMLMSMLIPNHKYLRYSQIHAGYLHKYTAAIMSSRGASEDVEVGCGIWEFAHVKIMSLFEIFSNEHRFQIAGA